MSASQIRVRRVRLNPFAFPSDTDVRFVLLIVTVLGTSLFIYSFFCRLTHFQELLGAASCEIPLTSKWLQAVFAQNAPAVKGATDAVRLCGLVYQRIETVYMLGGVLLIGVVAFVIYWLFPFWNLWRGKLMPLSAEDSPELIAYLEELCREAQLPRPPSFVCNPFTQTTTGLAFGRVGRYYVALSGGLVTLFTTDRASFRAIVLHELAHLHNADVNKTYFAIAIWWAFVIVALVPFAAFALASALRSSEDRYLFLDDAWRVLVMTVIVFLILAATLRVREYYADARSAIWEDSADPLLRVLNRLALPKKRWPRLMYVHPDPSERGRTLTETDRLFRMGLWDAFGIGIAVGIAVPNIQELVNVLFYLLPQITSSDLPEWQTFGTALMLAPLIAVTVGLSTWRTTFAALVRGQVPLGIGRAGLCIGAGLILGTFLSLSIFSSSLLVNPLFLLILSLPWSLMVLVSLFLFLHVLMTGASTWLDVVISSRSPRLIYTIGLVMISGVLVAILAQLFLFRLLATNIAVTLNTPFDLMIGCVIVIVGSLLLLIYDTLLSPVVFIAFIGLWAYPLAAWFWRKEGNTPIGSHWAFSDASSPPLVLPRHDHFRLRFALIVGLVSGLVYCLLFLATDIVWHVSVSAASRGTVPFASLFFYGNILLSALLQAIAAGIVTGRIGRSGIPQGLFAAFVAGCVMMAGILGINLLFGNSETASFIWIVCSSVINAGALLAVPITLIVSKIVSRTRTLHREKATP